MGSGQVRYMTIGPSLPPSPITLPNVGPTIDGVEHLLRPCTQNRRSSSFPTPNLALAAEPSLFFLCRHGRRSPAAGALTFREAPIAFVLSAAARIAPLPPVCPLPRLRGDGLKLDGSAGPWFQVLYYVFYS